MMNISSSHAPQLDEEAAAAPFRIMFHFHQEFTGDYGSRNPSTALSHSLSATASHVKAIQPERERERETA
jgi:hypothetical protein